jgi:hypothetical protein
MEASVGNINKLLKIWAANNVAFFDGAEPIFANVEELHSAIDDSTHGGAAWRELEFKYDGHVDDHSPPWKKATYISHTRNALEIVKNMVASPEFRDKWDTTPMEEYYTVGHERRYSNFMSGRWAWREAVSCSRHPLGIYTNINVTGPSCPKPTNPWRHASYNHSGC